MAKTGKPAAAALPSVSATLPASLDPKARAEALDAQAAMVDLVRLVKRDFGYADELGIVFRADRAG